MRIFRKDREDKEHGSGNPPERMPMPFTAELHRPRSALEKETEGAPKLSTQETRSVAHLQQSFRGVSTVPASLKLIFVFDFDVSHHHGQLLLWISIPVSY